MDRERKPQRTRNTGASRTKCTHNALPGTARLRRWGHALNALERLKPLYRLVSASFGGRRGIASGQSRQFLQFSRREDDDEKPEK